MDPLDDELFAEGSAKPARAVGKFQPKTKARPLKKGPVAAPSSQTIQLGNADKCGTITAMEAGQPSARGSMESSSEHIVPVENVCAPVRSHMEGDIGSDRDLQFSLEKSVGENVDIYLGLEPLDGFLPQGTNDMANVSKGDGEEQLSIPVTLPADDSAPVSNIPGAQIDSIDMGIEEIERYHCSETPDGPELNTISGKFQPKHRVQVFTENCEQDSESTDVLDKERLPEFAADDVLDFSSLGFDLALPTDSTSEVPANEEMPSVEADFPAEHPSSSGINEDEEIDKEFQVENESQKRKTRKKSKNQEHPQNSEINEDEDIDEEFHVENESQKRKTRKKSKKQEDSISSGINEDKDIDEEFRVENESQKKKPRKKSKKQAGDKEKPGRKRKKANDETDQGTKEKPKKFPHTTRQKRRTVDPVLLETPVDQLKNVRIKDLILLGEHKERLAKKEAPSQTPQENPSFGHSSELNNEEETFNNYYDDEDENGETFDEQATTQVEDSTIYFNYQTFMEKTPRARWSKEDTELFYEAIHQFGSDFSMIQQLFPGRTRAQIRLKYKNEERHHPSRIHDALTNRAKDHSHFEQVIKRLKQVAAEENQNDDDIDKSIDLTGEEEEVEGQREEAKSDYIGEKEKQVHDSEHIEEKEKEVHEMEQDFTQVQSPVEEEIEEYDYDALMSEYEVR